MVQIYTRIKDPNSNILVKTKKINILIINNSEQVATLFKKMLAEFGFSSVHLAYSAFRAVQILRENKINLVIADTELKIPKNPDAQGANASSDEATFKLSGYDFVSRLRHSPNSPNRYIPVVMLADVLEDEQLHKARDAGVNEVLPKPLSAPELCQKLEAVIDSPRIFITASTYKGPCRRRTSQQATPDIERRKAEIRVIKCNESI